MNSKTDRAEVEEEYSIEQFATEFPHAFAQMNESVSGNGRIKNPAYVRWVAQVNANYHDGRMSSEMAERVAGIEPKKHISAPPTRVIFVGNQDDLQAEIAALEFETDANLAASRGM